MRQRCFLGTPGLDCPKVNEASRLPSCWVHFRALKRRTEYTYKAESTPIPQLTPAPGDITTTPNFLLEELSRSVLAMTPVPGPLPSLPSPRPGSQQTTLRARERDIVELDQLRYSSRRLQLFSDSHRHEVWLPGVLPDPR